MQPYHTKWSGIGLETHARYDDAADSSTAYNGMKDSLPIIASQHDMVQRTGEI